MPRIRNLKPIFFDSPSTAKADLACRLLYEALWCWADDSGHGTCNLKELEAFAFPHDAIKSLPRRKCGGSACICGISAAVWRNFAEILHETAQAYDLVLYIVRSRRYYFIPSFKDHQSKFWRADTTMPEPDDGELWDLTSEYGPFRSQTCGGCDSSPEIPEHSCGNSAASSGISLLDRDGDRDGDREISSDPDGSDHRPRMSYPKAFEAWWQHYPRKDAKGSALTAWQKARKRASDDELIEGAKRYAADPNREPHFTKQPTTWLNGNCWESDNLPARNGRPALDYDNA